MKSSRAALRYAKALLNFALENKQEETVAIEMQTVLSIINESPELEAALDNPILSGSKKSTIMAEVFKSNSKTTQSLFLLLSTNKREGPPPPPPPRTSPPTATARPGRHP